MPIYFWWGEDSYQLQKSITSLRQQVINPEWQDFNYQQLNASSETEMILGLATAVTPAFGTGDRLTWLDSVSICQKCSEAMLKELERTLPQIPTNSHLLFTATQKPDSRLKVTKLLQKYAEFTEYSPIPPWKTEAIVQAVKVQAAQHKLSLTEGAIDYLVEAVGNDLRRLDMELTKLALAYLQPVKPLTKAQIKELVIASAGNSIQLAQALKNGECDRAIQLLAELFRNNEASLRICATLVGQFRTWLLVKLAISVGEKDEAIAKIAELGNPKRVYFLRQEVQSHSHQQLLATLPILLELEANLKRGSDAQIAFTSTIYQICHLWQAQ